MIIRLVIISRRNTIIFKLYLYFMRKRKIVEYANRAKVHPMHIASLVKTYFKWISRNLILIKITFIRNVHSRLYLLIVLMKKRVKREAEIR